MSPIVPSGQLTGALPPASAIRGVSEGGVLLPASSATAFGPVTFRADVNAIFRATRWSFVPGEEGKEAPKPKGPLSPGPGYWTDIQRQDYLSIYWTVPLPPEHPWPENSEFILPLVLWLEEFVEAAGYFKALDGGGAGILPGYITYGKQFAGTPEIFLSYSTLALGEFAPGIGYRVPLPGWIPGAGGRYDPLTVGLGNYAPRPGDRLYTLMTPQRAAIEAWDAAYKAASLPEKEATNALLKVEMETEISKYSELESNYSAAATAWAALIRNLIEQEAYEGHPLSPAETAALKVLVEDYRAKNKEYVARFLSEIAGPGRLLQWGEAYLDEGLSPPQWLAKRRRRIGPFLNGVERWAYRFNLSKPWPEGPDLTKATTGELVIEARIPAGGRQPGEEASQLGEGIGHGAGPGGLLVRDYPIDGAFEVQKGGARPVGATGAMQAGTLLAGRVG